MNISPQTIKVLISHRYVPEVTLKPSLPSCLYQVTPPLFAGFLWKFKEVQATFRRITAVKS